MGGFEFAVFQRNLKEWHKRPWPYVCECYRKATKVGSKAAVSGTVYRSYPILPFGIVARKYFMKIAVYRSMRQIYREIILGRKRVKTERRENTLRLLR